MMEFGDRRRMMHAYTIYTMQALCSNHFYICSTRWHPTPLSLLSRIFSKSWKHYFKFHYHLQFTWEHVAVDSCYYSTYHHGTLSTSWYIVGVHVPSIHFIPISPFRPKFNFHTLFLYMRHWVCWSETPEVLSPRWTFNPPLPLQGVVTLINDRRILAVYIKRAYDVKLSTH